MEIAINDIEDYSVRLRVRSERRRKRAKRNAYDKLLLQMRREERAINREFQELGWRILDPPVQAGYIRSFVLCEDLKRTRQAAFFERLLERINVRQWSYRKDFLIKRRKLGRKIYVPREHTLDALRPWTLAKANLTVDEWKYFSEETVYDSRLRYSHVVYRFTEPWRFVLRVQPNMITKVPVQDIDLERRKADIGRYFLFDDRREHLDKLLNGNTFGWYKRLKKRPTLPKYRSPFDNRSFADILSEYYPEPNFRITHKNPQSPGVFYFDHVNAALGNLQAAPTKLGPPPNAAVQAILGCICV